MPREFRYDPYRSPYAPTIADVLGRKGDIAAQRAMTIGDARARAEEVSGHAWGQAAQQIGQTVAMLPGQMQAANAQQTRVDAMKAQQAQDAALAQLFSGERPPSPKDILRVVGPDRGMPIIQGLSALAELEQGAVKDARDTAGRLALGVKALSPAMQAQVWPQIRASAIKGGLGDEQTIPAEPSADYLDAILGWASGKSPDAPKTREVKVRNPDGSESIQIVEDKPGQVFPSTAEPPKTLDAALAAAYQHKDDAEVSRLLALKQREAAAQRAPVQPEYEWVTRDGKPAQIRKGSAQPGDVPYRAGVSVDAAMPSEYQTALERSIMSIPAVRRGSVVNTANRLWSEGNTDELKQVIKQAAIESEPVDSRNQVRGRELTLVALADAKQMLADLRAKGVPTGWLAGGMENLARKLGKTTNPDYVTLSTRLMDTVIQYRRAATGVQFSQRESQEYGRMFPNYSQDLPVNEAAIEGLTRAVEGNNAAYWTGKLGEAGATLVGAVGTGSEAGAADGWIDLGNGVRMREKK